MNGNNNEWVYHFGAVKLFCRSLKGVKPSVANLSIDLYTRSTSQLYSDVKGLNMFRSTQVFNVLNKVVYVHISIYTEVGGRPDLPDHTDPRGVDLPDIHSGNFLVLFRP